MWATDRGTRQLVPQTGYGHHEEDIAAQSQEAEREIAGRNGVPAAIPGGDENTVTRVTIMALIQARREALRRQGCLPTTSHARLAARIDEPASNGMPSRMDQDPADGITRESSTPDCAKSTRNSDSERS